MTQYMETKGSLRIPNENIEAAWNAIRAKSDDPAFVSLLPVIQDGTLDSFLSHYGFGQVEHLEDGIAAEDFFERIEDPEPLMRTLGPFMEDGQELMWIREDNKVSLYVSNNGTLSVYDYLPHQRE